MNKIDATNPSGKMSLSDIRHFIDGAYTADADGACFDNINPVDGTKNGVIHKATRAEVDAAVKAARAALNGEWGRMPTAARVQILYAIADEIDARAEEFLAAEIADTGKPRSLASHLDIPRGAANFRVFADMVKNEPTESFFLETPDGHGALNYGVRKPKGVIGVISPWNMPLLLMTWKVGPALACGNTVIVKPSEETPATTTLLGEVMNAVGVPRGVFNVVHGHGPDAAGEFLTTHPGVDAITFTGEIATGEAIMKAAANGVRDVSLELGGKNPGIIFADADFDAAVAGTVRSAFSNCGQVCLGTEQVYVERPIFDRFVAELAKQARALKHGHPDDADTSIGPLVSKQHRDKVKFYYDLAVREGATVVTGGGIPDMGDLNGGWWVEPTIWTGLADDARVINEEVFGPCCHIRPFDTEEEVMRLANDSEYGLAATIWTTDSSRAHRVARRMEVGIVWVNAWFLRDLRTPFGGSKSSGIGREGGVHSLEFYTELSNVCVKL